MGKKSLYPALDPVTINPKAFLFWIFVFALAFGMMGILTRHYVTLQSVGI